MNLNPYVRILDFLTFLSLFVALTCSYQSRFSKAKTVSAMVVFCGLGVAGTLLEEQMVPFNFLLYAINYMLWGCIYSAVFLKGQLGLKAAMTAVFCASVFYTFDFARVIGMLTGVMEWRYFSLPFIMLSAVFLYKTALHSSRKVSVKVWGTIVAAALLGIIAYT